jgi:hypothetical protein
VLEQLVAVNRNTCFVCLLWILRGIMVVIVIVVVMLPPPVLF